MTREVMKLKSTAGLFLTMIYHYHINAACKRELSR